MIVLGGGNTAMDCCRTPAAWGRGREGDRPLGFDEMKASPWEKEDAIGEDIPSSHARPEGSPHEAGKIKGVLFEKVVAKYDDKGRRSLVPSGEPDEFYECDDVLVAIGQENAFPWIEKDCRHRVRQVGPAAAQREDLRQHASEGVLRRRRGVRPEDIIWAAAHGHEAATSIHKMLIGENPRSVPRPASTSPAREDGHPRVELRQRSHHRPSPQGPASPQAGGAEGHHGEVELGFDPQLAFKEAQAMPQLRRQTVFSGQLCIECDACVDICPMDCITFTETVRKRGCARA